MKKINTHAGRPSMLSLPICSALAAVVWTCATGFAPVAWADPAPQDAAAAGKVPLILNLPGAAFKGTPKDIPEEIKKKVEPLSDKPRPPMLVPAGLKNIAPGSKITCSDKNAPADALAKITDGNKEAQDESVVFLRKGVQWVQLDLGSVNEIYAIVVWHAHNSAKVYHSVVVQAADDADFIDHVQTIYNNDQNNTAGLGVGTDREYFETNEGRLIDAKGIKSRYLRFYSKGSTESAMNEYTEIEVYGRPSSK